MRGAIIVLLLQFGGKKFNMLLIGARAVLGLLYRCNTNFGSKISDNRSF